MIRIIHYLFAALVICWIAAAASPAQPATTQAAVQIPVHEESFTASVDGTRQTYLLAEWGADRPEPPLLVLYLHGSGSHQDQGTKPGIYFDVFGRMARWMAARGHTIYICPEYRGSTWMGPKADADVVQILSIARDRYHPAKVLLTGGSMGGTSALIFASLHPDLLNGVLAWCPATDPIAMYPKFPDQFRAGYGGSPNDVPDEYHKRTSRDHVDALAKLPIAIVHGSADQVIPVEHSRVLVDRLKARGATVQYIEVKNAGHDGPFVADVGSLLDWLMSASANKSPTTQGISK
jgi:dipeptidyl aminopeptidase/acylaminoacyl peptidase